MAHPLFIHLNKYVEITDSEFNEILPYFELKQINKKDYLLKSQTYCTHHFFVLEGCLHLFFTSDKGVERTVQFAIENWWITDHLAYLNQNQTDFNIQAIETSTVLSISFKHQEELLIKYPKLERYFRIIFQIAYGASLFKIKYLYGLSKAEIYFHFTTHFPEFAQRVPQYLIASFLGLTPEYVSEIRAKHRS